MSGSPVQRFVLLPRRGLRASSSPLSVSVGPLLRSLSAAVGTRIALPAAGDANIRVIDSISEDGAKLVECDTDDLPAIRAAHPDANIVPVAFYEIARARERSVRAAPSSLAVNLAAGVQRLSLRVVDSKTGSPVAKAKVVAFTDFAHRFGDENTSKADGTVRLNLGRDPIDIERLYVYPPLAGYWGAFRQDIQLTSGMDLALEPIDLAQIDCLRHFHGAAELNEGLGVTVGIIDTGTGPHADVICQGDLDNGEGHGTHVAGIIAGRGMPPTGVRGVAPGVTLRSYRVFGVPHGLAASFTIAKAIDQAVRDGCDLINLSLKINEDNFEGLQEEETVKAAIGDARQAGTLPIVAAGNDYRKPVSYPARDSLCIAVSALGRKRTFPDGSLDDGDITEPFGTDSDDFIAAFSNMGPEMDATGPGTGVISSVPGGYGVMSGTSMACPAVTGMAARLLARRPDILNMPRDAERSTAIARLILQSAQSLGFDFDLQGQGILR